ncbi:cyclin-dependent kinase 2-associated protein 1-like [Chrysoperla carnea]|uniref:cyclin-dependent kinase 2-associated protein 1-like n=1 Tax=Chrysoperla carnea TaxID=189513 RepID=UPI001D066A05|nr:cyclin-dependent kinase 2-associated protein 1-like [Chrysoperla carnea]
MEVIDIQAVESKLSDVTVTAIPCITPKTPQSNGTNTSHHNHTQQVMGQSKYAQLLSVIEEMGKELRPTYSGSKSSAERLKRGIVHARILVRECLMETERSGRQ